MLLDYCEHTRDTAFLTKEALPWADAMVRYFDTRFKRDAAGRLVIHPAESIETYQDVTNPVTDVAGLHAVLERLLALPAELTDAAARERWARFQKELPDLPMAEKDGRKLVTPAAVFGGRSNCENPELYTVFPFRIYGVGRPNLQLGRDTYAARIEKAFHGWQQASVQAACLGLAGEARNMVVSNAGGSNPAFRFPATWGPNYDWIPDQCHGGNLLNATQTMLLQCDARHIYLFPAWPKEWDVSFKLHAPFDTTVQGELRGGRVISLTVTPQSRAADVVNLLGS
jgi:alpha-L-fucosidase 2